MGFTVLRTFFIWFAGQTNAYAAVILTINNEFYSVCLVIGIFFLGAVVTICSILISDGKVVVIISDRNSNMSLNEENFITSRIVELLDDKGVIFWWKGNKPQKQTPKRSWSFGRKRAQKDNNGAAVTVAESEACHLCSDDFTLLFKARLHYGEISLQDENEKCDEDELPPEIKESLRKKWQSTADAELLVFREKTTGDYRTIVNPIATSPASKVYEIFFTT